MSDTPSSPPSTYPAVNDDEIDLVELGVSLWHKRFTVIGTFIVCLVIGLGFALSTPKKYQYAAAIQLGSIADSNGQLQPVVSPDSALTLLNKVVLPQVIDDYSRAHGIDPRSLKVQATLASAITLAGEGPVGYEADFSAIESAAASQLAQLTERQLQSRLSILKYQLAKAQEELQLLQSPQQPSAGVVSKGSELLLLANQSRILAQKTLITTLEGQIGSAQPTRLLSRPVRSPEPVGLASPTIVALAGILGIFLGLLAAMLSGYIQAVRKRLRTLLRPPSVSS